MPARKPQGLKTRHDTKAEKAERIAQEESMAPVRELPLQAPARLKDHSFAAEVWRRLMRGWSEIEAQVVTRLDMDLLIDYCLLMEQVGELDLMRSTTYQMWLDLGLAHGQAKKKAKESMAAVKESINAGVNPPETGPGSMNEAARWEEQAIEMACKSLDAFEAVVKLDGRVDRKRALLLQWRQSLYLTPRARAGAAPDRKEKPEEVVDPLEALLNNVNEFVNGEQK